VFDQLRSEEDHKNVIEQCFTLVELLIVIIILGILAGIVVFAVGNLQSNSQKSACATEAATFQAAYNAFIAANPGKKPGNGTYDSDHVISDLTNATYQTAAAVPTANNGGPYLTKAPNKASASGFWDDTKSTTALYGDTAATTAANGAQKAEWNFDPASGKLGQATGTNNSGQYDCK
jgi:prepilin-type N-terminal cleavage/methylation domain-containing protein